MRFSLGQDPVSKFTTHFQTSTTWACPQALATVRQVRQYAQRVAVSRCQTSQPWDLSRGTLEWALQVRTGLRLLTCNHRRPPLLGHRPLTCAPDVVAVPFVPYSLLLPRQVSSCCVGEEQQPLPQSSPQSQPQHRYKGLGTHSVVSSDGEPLTRVADASLAGSGATAATTASNGAAMDGLATVGSEGELAGGLGSQGGSVGDTNAGISVTGSTGADVAGVAGMAEPAQAVSMDGDIIATASKAEALAAAESPHTGATWFATESALICPKLCSALDCKLNLILSPILTMLKFCQVTSALCLRSSSGPQRQTQPTPTSGTARFASASQSKASAADSEPIGSADKVVSSDSLLAGRSSNEEDVRAGGRGAGAHSAEMAAGAGLGAGRGRCRR